LSILCLLLDYIPPEFEIGIFIIEVETTNRDCEFQGSIPSQIRESAPALFALTVTSLSLPPPIVTAPTLSLPQRPPRHEETAGLKLLPRPLPRRLPRSHRDATQRVLREDLRQVGSL